MCATQSRSGFISIPLLIWIALSLSIISLLFEHCAQQLQIVRNYHQHWQIIQRLDQDLHRLIKQQALESSEVKVHAQFFIANTLQQQIGWQIQELTLIDLQNTHYQLSATIGQMVGSNKVERKFLLGWRLATNI